MSIPTVWFLLNSRNNMEKISRYIVLSACLAFAGTSLLILGCENPSIKDAGEKIKESTAKTGEAVKDFSKGVSEETAYILEEIKKGTNAAVTEIKEGGLLVSKKGGVLVDKTKEEFSEVAIVAKIKAKYAKSPKVSMLHISVSVVENRVILTGKVHCKEEIAEAITLALSVDGVENVTSLLEIIK